MPRFPTLLSALLNLVLIVVVVAQARMLQERSAAAPSERPRSAALEAADAAVAAHHDERLAAAVLERLGRIDARLAALETAGPGAPAAPPPPERLDPGSFAEADRRLAALLPDRDLDAEDWVRWQSTLAALPPAERHAVSAAFARAVNQDRIRLRF